MRKSKWSAFACASFLGLTVTCGSADVAQAQGYREGYRDRNQDRSRDWDIDDDNFNFGRGGVEFGDEPRCEWVTRRYIDRQGHEVIRRRRVCD